MANKLSVQRDADKNLCKGGQSFNRKKYEHEQGVLVNCYRCGAVMGCVRCVEAPRELICLRCNNWAARQGVYHHGDVIPSRKIQHVHTDRGWEHWQGESGVNKLPDIKGLVK